MQSGKYRSDKNATRLIQWGNRFKNSTTPKQKEIIEGKRNLIPGLEARNEILTTFIENLEGDLAVSTTMPSDSDLER